MYLNHIPRYTLNMFRLYMYHVYLSCVIACYLFFVIIVFSIDFYVMKKLQK